MQIIPIRMVEMRPNHRPAFEKAIGIARIPDPSDPVTIAV